MQLVYEAPPLSWTFFYDAVLDADALEAALSRALESYPVLAGRVVTMANDAHGRCRLAVACDNQGALLTRLNLPSVELPRSRGVQSGELPAWGKGWAGPPSLAKLQNDRAAPLLEVMLVSYARGCSLCIKSSHGITDGQSLALFLACWSRTYADAQSPMPWPLLERTAQDEQGHLTGDGESGQYEAACSCVRAPRSEVASSPSGAIEDLLPAGTLARLAMRAVVDPSMGFHAGSQAVVGACFHFTAAQLAHIKCAAAAYDAAPPAEAAAEEGSSAVGHEQKDARDAQSATAPTTFDALVALLWRSVTLARKRRGALDRAHLLPPRLFFPANVRGRMAPPLPNHFVGNATMGILVQLDSETCAQSACFALWPCAHARLCRMRTGGLCTVAAAVQRHKSAAVTAASIAQQLAYLDAETRRGRKKRWTVNPFDNGVLLSDWRFPDAPLYDAATFGKAAPFWFEPALDVAMRFPYVGCLLQSPPGSPAPGIAVLINLPADEVSAVMQSLADAAAC